MKNFYFFLFLAASCASEKQLISESKIQKESVTITPKKIILAKIGRSATISNPIQIMSVKLSANLLTLDIKYTGGCIEHDFQMIGSASIAKSMPPIRFIELIDTTTNDDCKKVTFETITIDISDLSIKKSKGSEIYLTLAGWPEKIKYIFE